MTLASQPRPRAHALSLPNLLTYGRIAAIPAVVAALFWAQEFQGGLWLRWVALVIFVAAALTDMLDGYFARMWELTSPLGRMLDPIADKLLVASCLLMLAADGTYLIVEPMAGDRLTDNINPVGRMFYAASTVICTANALSQEPRTALGAHHYQVFEAATGQEALAGQGPLALGDALTALAKGWFRAVSYAAAQPEAAARQVAPHVGLTEEDYRRAVAGMRFPTRDENCILLAADPRSLRDTVARLHAVMLKTGLLPAATPPGEVFDPRLIRRLGCTDDAGAAG